MRDQSGLACLLLNLALEKVIRETSLDMRGTILHKSIQILAYADDDVIGRYRRTVNEFNFIHFWSITLVNTIKTTSFTPPSVIKLHLLFAHAIKCFVFLVSEDGLLKKPKHVKACANNKCNLITLGGVNVRLF
jgi:hypothetical protein